MGDDVIGFDFSNIGVAFYTYPFGYIRCNSSHLTVTNNKYRPWGRSGEDGNPAQKRRSSYAMAYGKGVKVCD